MPPIVVRDPGGEILDWNAGCEQLFGIPASAARGRDAHRLLGTRFPAPRAEIEAALRRDGCWSGELRLHLPDGRRLAVAAHWRLEPPAGAEGAGQVVETLIDLTAARADIEALRGAEAELAQERARLALVQEAAGLGLWDLDLRTGRAWVSPGWRALYGLPEGEVGLAEWLALLHPEDRPGAEAALQAAIKAGTSYCLRFRIHRADTGALRWIEGRGRRLDTPAGEPGRFLGVSLDITAQKAEEERTALLMREVDHRAKNALSTVQALLRLTRADSPQDFARALEGRIAALGRAHALLAQDRRAGPELRALLEAEFAPYLGGGPARLVLEGPGLVLTTDTVQPLSMVVHELVTNAAKYGALSRPGGQVGVAWRVTPEGWLHIDWQERGGPPLAGPPARLGFGSSLLRSLAARQLGGSVEKRWEEGGLQCRITLPPQVLAPSG